MAAPSQTLPMVDGGWGGLWYPSITCIGYELEFGASGLIAGSDMRLAAREHRACADSREVLRVHISETGARRLDFMVCAAPPTSQRPEAG